MSSNRLARQSRLLGSRPWVHAGVASKLRPIKPGCLPSAHFRPFPTGARPFHGSRIFFTGLELTRSGLGTGTNRHGAPSLTCTPTSSFHAESLLQKKGTEGFAVGSKVLERSPAQSSLHFISKLFDEKYGWHDTKWAERIQKAEALLSRNQGRVKKISVVGRKLSGTDALILNMFDEPLRQMNNSGRSEFDRLKAKLDEGKNIFIRHANQPTQETKSNDDSSIFLDSDLLLGENVELQVCLDSDHDPSTIDNLYMSDSIFFVTDMYQLTQHLQKAPSLEQNSLDPTLRLLSMFASKPDTHLVVIDNMNAKLGSSVRDALEASIGPASTETFYRTSQRNESFDPILHVSVQKTQTGIDALRKALSQGDEGGRDIEASHLWGIFSDSYSSSGIGSVQKALANSSRRESQPLGETTKLEYMCRHAFSEAVASVQKAKVELTTVEGFGTSLYDDASDSIRLARLEILGIDSSQPIRSDRCQEDPVEVSIEETRGKLVKLFRQKLAWWKILWKADDFRSELEQVCSGFGRHLETQLCFDSGKLSANHRQSLARTIQVVDESVRVTSRIQVGRKWLKEALLLRNDIHALASDSSISLKPDALSKPITFRRFQLASAGGPIDALTERVQRLAITAYATAGASTAAIAYLTILGAYFPSSPLTEFHLDPSTALGIWALVAMLLAWRVQGRYAKVQRLFWEDWSRLSAGLEHDLQENLDEVLRRRITRPSLEASSRLISISQNWLKELQGIESALVRIKEARKW